jgi:hypothetical protein
LSGSFTSGGNNIIDGVGNATGFSGPETTGYSTYSLPALANNGGLTKTLLPGAGNAAIDNGACTDFDGATLTTDQRGTGYVRPSGTTCDVGAVEVQAVSNPTLAVAPTSWGFGSVTIGVPYQKSFSITNTGGGTLNVTNMAMTGGNSGDFTVSLSGGATCTTLTPSLTALQSCTVTVTHTASAPAGSKSTTFRITSNTGGTAGTNTDVALSSSAIAGSIPTLSEWGMFTMFLGLAGAMFHTMRKRQSAGEA